MSKYRNASPLQPGETVTDEQFATELNILAFTRAARRVNRRNFITGAGLAAGAAGVVAITAGCGSSTTTAPVTSTAVSIGDVLNFALNLEYLEANFYLTLTTGSGLPAQYGGTSPGAVTGGLGQVTFTLPGVQDLANQLAQDEMTHVEFLRTTLSSLGVTPVDQPALDLAALGPVTDDATFLALARALETVGVSAYEGAITLLVSNTTALDYAATIHATEGQHEGALRQYCIANNVVSPAVDSNDMPPLSSSGTVTIFNTSPTTGLNTSRDTSQVLGIVYANTATGTSKGGFYPDGMTGSINTISGT